MEERLPSKRDSFLSLSQVNTKPTKTGVLTLSQNYTKAAPNFGTCQNHTKAAPKFGIRPKIWSSPNRHTKKLEPRSHQGGAPS